MLRALKATPLPVSLLIASFLCPTEFSLFLGGLRLPPHRVVLILLAGFALMKLLTRRDVRLRAFDFAFVAFNSWVLFAYNYHAPGGSGFIYGGSLVLEGMGAYLIARAYVRDAATLNTSLKVVVGAIAFAALIALPETLLGRNFTHDFLHSLTGYYHPTAIYTRLGLTRAYGTFDHPIHYGTFCAGLFALLWFSQVRPAVRRSRAALLSGATFLGISSAPLLCLMLQFGLIVWERVTRSIPARTMITIACLVGLLIGASLASSRSIFAVIATRLTLDSWTGFYRLQIWEHGLNNVWAHPWLGIGLNEWDRPWWMAASTVDAFWLVVAMQTGLPGILLLLLAVILLAYAVVRRRRAHKDKVRRRMMMGWMISLIALCLIAATVHFWNVLYTYFFFFLGLGAVFADPKAPVRRRASVEPEETYPYVEVPALAGARGAGVGVGVHGVRGARPAGVGYGGNVYPPVRPAPALSR